MYLATRLNLCRHWLCVSSLAALASFPAHADLQACTLEGQVNAMGTPVDTKGCMEATTSEPIAKLKETCPALAQLATVSGGGPAKMP